MTQFICYGCNVLGDINDGIFSHTEEDHLVVICPACVEALQQARAEPPQQGAKAE